LARAYP